MECGEWRGKVVSLRETREWQENGKAILSADYADFRRLTNSNHRGTEKANNCENRDKGKEAFLPRIHTDKHR